MGGGALSVVGAPNARTAGESRDLAVRGDASEQVIARVANKQDPIGGHVKAQRRAKEGCAADAIGKAALPRNPCEGCDHSVGADFSNRMVAGVGDEEISMLVQSDSARAIELRL